MRISDWSSDVCSSDLHLDEEEFAVFPQELDRPGAAIVHPGHRVGADAAHSRALLGRDDGGGGFLEHFLVPPLERAVALAQMDGIAVAVAEDLEFDVARVAEIFLHIRSEEHTSELQSLMRISYAVFCLKK